MTQDAQPVWARAMLALRLLAADPGLGGLVLRARSGPARDAFLTAVDRIWPETVKLHPAMPDDAMFGGLEIEATLATGKPVHRRGLAEREAPLILTMAERTAPRLAARLAMMLDGVRSFPLIALDEGAEKDEATPRALADRLAFHVDLDGLMLAGLSDGVAGAEPAVPARLTEDQIARIAHLAEALGVTSLRAAGHAIRAARAHASVCGRNGVADQDLEAATALVLVPRATRLPPANEEAEEPSSDEATSEDSAEEGADLPDEMLIAAARALLPDDLLEQVGSARLRHAKGDGSGASRIGNRRGRPIPSRPGRLDGSSRLDLVATLRAAAPWQKARRVQRPDHDGLLVRPGDIHMRRHEQNSDRLLIFVVDASGSAALSRLNEAKGAVEQMLGDAYSRRDHVALIAFRGEQATMLLPPTRSLVRTKRELAALPGGGASPLAAGLMEALTLARAARKRGWTPTLILLTDGRANVALDGGQDRERAMADAMDAARALGAGGCAALVLDIGPRPNDALDRLSRKMQGRYLALPRANSKRISSAISDMLDG